MTVPAQLSFRNWRRYQHYTDRKPPWIKLYTDFRTDTEHLSEQARLMACLLFTVAAERDNRFRSDERWMAVELNVSARTVRVGLAELIADGMLADADTVAREEAANPAGKVASASRAPARSKETEREKEALVFTSGTQNTRSLNNGLPLVELLRLWVMNAGYHCAWTEVLEEIDRKQRDRGHKLSDDELQGLHAVWSERHPTEATA